MKTRAKRFVSALLAGVLCLSLLAGCASKKKELTRYSTVFYDVFDTVTQVIAYCESEEEFNTQMDALHADLITYNQLYDIYNDYPGVTNVKTINDNAGSAPVVCGNHRHIEDRYDGPETCARIRNQAGDLLSHNACEGIDGGGHEAGEGAQDHKANGKGPVCPELSGDQKSQGNEQDHRGDHGAHTA